MSDYIRELAWLMRKKFCAMFWISIVLLSTTLIVALAILVVALFYFILTLIFGLVFEWYIPIAIGVCFLIIFGMIPAD